MWRTTGVPISGACFNQAREYIIPKTFLRLQTWMAVGGMHVKQTSISRLRVRKKERSVRLVIAPDQDTNQFKLVGWRHR